ncbi:signal transducer and activator of transcription 5B isoform X3 [Dendroctonus ponderosae]|uniref:Signal transducer and activator of transcription n=1 Tax=Dendroctonus ponderosae TaxID=77166 RepID=A0AAR5PTN8_DENPD|nr:signal transducer and activator of transcription 5B isoform X3 [Dendroctonus ponderosae]
MALWTKAQLLPNESVYFQQIKSIYGEHFPIEVRHYLAHFIEDKFWHEPLPTPDHPSYEAFIANVVDRFIQEIENKAESTNDAPEQFLIKLKLAEAAKMFRLRYSSNPTQLFHYIRQCLSTELKLVQSAGPIHPLPIPSNVSEILKLIDMVHNKTKALSHDINELEKAQVAFATQYNECTKVNAHLQQINKQAVDTVAQFISTKEYLESELNGQVANVIEIRVKIIEEFSIVIRITRQLQSLVIDEELTKWKREQQLAGNGFVFKNNVDEIQDWCESLADTLWANRMNIKEFERIRSKLALDSPSFADPVPGLDAEITELLSSLVTSTFIIDKQPPQVMKTHTRFTAGVRLLVGNKLNVYMSTPVVKVCIISETQANLLLKNEKSLPKTGDTAGEILNNNANMEIQGANKQLTVSFRNMQLKRIKRAEKKGTESVMDEKFSLLFKSQFAIGGGQMVYQVWTLSLPVVVIVHGNQEPHAWATVTWDNAFSESNRTPFQVPDKVPWSKVRETLSQKFKAATGRALSEDNLHFLADKLFRGNFMQSTTQAVSWGQFCKEPLPERTFTFWEWFYAIMKLTKEHLRGPWEDGAIMGFIKKGRAEELLQSCPVGTFLLRFSDSELGGITIAWISETREVLNLQPFTAKDFVMRSLADRIYDIHELITLYPDSAKEFYFEKYCTSLESTPSGRNGYVRPMLVTTVPKDGFNTPQHNSSFATPDLNRDTPSVASSGHSLHFL